MHCLGSDSLAGMPRRNVELDEFATSVGMLQLGRVALFVRDSPPRN